MKSFTEKIFVCFLLLAGVIVCYFAVRNIRTVSEDMDTEYSEAEKEAQLHWLAEHSERWSEKNGNWEMTYSVTDFDEDGFLEIAQNIKGDYFYYQEISREKDSYTLKDAGIFSTQDFIYGLPKEKDGSILPDDTLFPKKADDFLPGEDARWLLSFYTKEDQLSIYTGELSEMNYLSLDDNPFLIEYTEKSSDGLLALLSSEDIFFESGVTFFLAGKVSEAAFYEALLKSFQSFKERQERIWQITSQLKNIYESGYYRNDIVGGGNRFAILDYDQDGLLELMIHKKSGDEAEESEQPAGSQEPEETEEGDAEEGKTEVAEAPEDVGEPGESDAGAEEAETDKVPEDTEEFCIYEMTAEGELVPAEMAETFLGEEPDAGELSMLQAIEVSASGYDVLNDAPVGCAFMKYSVWLWYMEGEKRIAKDYLPGLLEKKEGSFAELSEPDLLFAVYFKDSFPIS